MREYKKHKWLYNAQNELETLHELDLYETPFRSYDAQLGRFHQADPLAPLYDGISPYQYAYNNPISFNDPMGLEAEVSPSVVPSTTSGAAPVANEVKAEVKSDDLPDAPMLEPIKEMPTLASAGPNVEMTLEKMPVAEQPEGDDEGGNSSGAVAEENSIEHQLNAAKSWGNGGGTPLVVYDKNGNYLSNDTYSASKDYGVAVEGPNGKLNILHASANDMLTHKELLDRANWIYGEGGGSFAYHYAHTIQNGYETNGNSELKTYHYLMRETYSRDGGVRKTQPIPSNEYFAGTWGNRTTGGTREQARNFNNKRSLAMDNMMRRSIMAVIESVINASLDPTKGCNQWRGDVSNKSVVYMNAAFFGTAGGRNHIFSTYGVKYKQKAQYTTDFTNK